MLRRFIFLATAALLPCGGFAADCTAISTELDTLHQELGKKHRARERSDYELAEAQWMLKVNQGDLSSARVGTDGLNADIARYKKDLAERQKHLKSASSWGPKFWKIGLQHEYVGFWDFVGGKPVFPKKELIQRIQWRIDDDKKQIEWKEKELAQIGTKIQKAKDTPVAELNARVRETEQGVKDSKRAVREQEVLILKAQNRFEDCNREVDTAAAPAASSTAPGETPATEPASSGEPAPAAPTAPTEVNGTL